MKGSARGKLPGFEARKFLQNRGDKTEQQWPDKRVLAVRQHPGATLSEKKLPAAVGFVARNAIAK